MPLKLSLKPGETIVVNGAVVQNGDRRGMLLLQSRARVLREKDLMRPEDVRDEVDNAYFTLMLYYLQGERPGTAHDRYVGAIRSALEAAKSPEARETIEDISARVAAGDTYKALSLLKSLRQSG